MDGQNTVSVPHGVVLMIRTALLLLPGAVLILLLYQIPVTHHVDIGGYDSTYVRGFHDPQDRAYSTQPYLEGSDGRVRWSRARSFLVFPQAGLPASLTLCMRGWDTDESTKPQVVTILLNGKDVLQRIQVNNTWQEYRIAVTGGLDKPHDVVIELRSPAVVLPSEGREVGVLLDAATYTVERGPGGLIVPYPAQVAYAALVSLLLWWVLALVHGDRATDQSAVRWIDRWRSTLARRKRVLYWTCLTIVGGLFVCCYRMQPPLYPTPLLWLLPGIAGVLSSVLIVAHGPAVLHRWPRLVHGVTLACVGGWCVVLLLAAQDHVTLSVPGVEKDFRVFATRVSSLDKIFHADGFYNLGYPLLLWLVHPLTQGNAFLAARLVAATSGAVLLLATYWLALLIQAQRWGGEHHSPSPLPLSHQERGSSENDSSSILEGRSLSPSPTRTHSASKSGWALLAVIMLALNPLVVQYALYVGSDMPFAALTILALALFVRAGSYQVQANTNAHNFISVRPLRSLRSLRFKSISPNLVPMSWLALAGIVAGWAFLMRHPGMVLLPWGIGALVLRHRGRVPRIVRDVLVFAAGFGLGALPQFVVNLVDTGSLLYSQQAKNIWLAVYGGIDWGRWHEVPDSISLVEVILRDPLRFVANWWRNVLAFMGNGAEDTSEFGQALQLRLLSWPANWLAVLGLTGWCWGSVRYWWGHRTEARVDDTSEDSIFWHHAPSLILFLALYVAGVCVGFVLPRFFLPLAPLYAVAASWLLQAVVYRIQNKPQMNADTHRHGVVNWQWLLIVGGVLVVLLHGGVHTGVRYVLDHQPADEVAIIEMTLDLLQPGDTVVIQVEPDIPIGKYSALAHHVVGLPDAPSTEAALVQAAMDGVDYLLWDNTVGLPPLPNPPAARVSTAGRYGVYALHAFASSEDFYGTIDRTDMHLFEKGAHHGTSPLPDT